MVGVWMAYACVVSVFLGLAALALDRVFRLYRLPGRWVWLAALVGTVVAPATVAVVRTGGSAGTTAGVASSADLELVAALMDGWSLSAAGDAAGWLDSALLLFWIAASVTTITIVGLSFASLRRRSTRWAHDRVAGSEVLVSDVFGPAVLGLLRPAIVLPRWALEMGSDALHLVLAHERQHVAAGDPRTLAMGVAAVAVMPWNPVSWWLLHRLRLAVELDCDRRVLRTGVPVDRYGRLLLDIGRRARPVLLPAAALSEPATLLERRIKTMLGGRVRGRIGQALLGAGVAGLLVFVACDTPDPSVVEAALETLHDENRAGRASRFESLADVTVYVDDQKLSDPGVDLLRLDRNNIERVEVIKRAADADPAAGPVVYIFTKDGRGLTLDAPDMGSDGRLDADGGRPDPPPA